MIGSVGAIKETVGEINLNGYIIWGGTEVILGIVMLIVHSSINKKKDEARFNKIINGNTPKDDEKIVDETTTNTETTMDNINETNTESALEKPETTNTETTEVETKEDNNTKQIDDISQN